MTHGSFSSEISGDQEIPNNVYSSFHWLLHPLCACVCLLESLSGWLCSLSENRWDKLETTGSWSNVTTHTQTHTRKHTWPLWSHPRHSKHAGPGAHIVVSKYAWASVGDSLSLRTCVCTWLHMWKRGSVFDSVQNGSSVWSTVWKSLSISDERLN